MALFDMQDPQTTWTIAGGVLAVVGMHWAYKRGQKRRSHGDDIGLPAGLVTGTGACPLDFYVGTSSSTGRVTASLEDMPHILIAGMTGSGKSTFLTAMLVDLIYECSPQELKLVLMDPKRVELAPFKTAPHVLSYEWDTNEMVERLAWVHSEMKRRYEVLEKIGVRKIEEAFGMPRIVIVIEELANVMLSSNRKSAQDLIVNLASTGRAVGLHLVLVTQRPSVDVVTGLIKANVPSRVALATVTQIDSRVILDQGGAETLAGHGDLLLMGPGMRDLVRLQGRQATDAEVKAAVDKWK